MSRPLYIFDLDGTLALIEHRRHHVQCPREQQNWPAFNAACVDDLPHLPILRIMDSLLRDGAEVWIFSGRSDTVRTQTIQWLIVNSECALTKIDHDAIQMRPAGDTTPDDKLKLNWLNNMLDEDRERLVAVFEDRDRMVAMWRAQGLTCLQVAPGDF